MNMPIKESEIILLAAIDEIHAGLVKNYYHYTSGKSLCRIVAHCSGHNVGKQGCPEDVNQMICPRFRFYLCLCYSLIY